MTFRSGLELPAVAHTHTHTHAHTPAKQSPVSTRQGWVSTRLSGAQSWPPLNATGLVHSRVRFRVPLPHWLVHSVHSLQPEAPPSTVCEMGWIFWVCEGDYAR